MNQANAPLIYRQGYASNLFNGKIICGLKYHKNKENENPKYWVFSIPIEMFVSQNKRIETIKIAILIGYVIGMLLVWMMNFNLLKEYLYSCMNHES